MEQQQQQQEGLSDWFFPSLLFSFELIAQRQRVLIQELGQTQQDRRDLAYTLASIFLRNGLIHANASAQTNLSGQPNTHNTGVVEDVTRLPITYTIGEFISQELLENVLEILLEGTMTTAGQIEEWTVGQAGWYGAPKEQREREEMEANATTATHPETDQ